MVFVPLTTLSLGPLATKYCARWRLFIHPHSMIQIKLLAKVQSVQWMMKCKMMSMAKVVVGVQDDKQ